VNPEQIVAQEEHGTATTQERLEAARKVCDRGFPVAFHIDPMIFVADWKEQYGALVDDLCARFTPAEMKWVSVGALRYLPSMKQMLRERFGGKTQVLLGEMLPGEDGKLRYDRALRNEMFKFVIDRFRRHDSRYPVFLCMETPESWINTLGSTPRRVENVQDLFVPVANV
jgi:spore photoproduct lyase